MNMILFNEGTLTFLSAGPVYGLPSKKALGRILRYGSIAFFVHGTKVAGKDLSIAEWI
jgi:hypothetical protein